MLPISSSRVSRTCSTKPSSQRCCYNSTDNTPIWKSTPAGRQDNAGAASGVDGTTIAVPAKNIFMPKQATIDAAKRDKAQGKSASTQAGEFVKEEMDKIHGGKTGARNTKQAIAIGLSEARRSGVALKAPAAASPAALSKQARTAARKRTPAERSTS